MWALDKKSTLGRVLNHKPTLHNFYEHSIRKTTSNEHSIRSEEHRTLRPLHIMNIHQKHAQKSHSIRRALNHDHFKWALDQKSAESLQKSTRSEENLSTHKILELENAKNFKVFKNLRTKKNMRISKSTHPSFPHLGGNVNRWHATQSSHTDVHSEIQPHRTTQSVQFHHSKSTHTTPETKPPECALMIQRAWYESSKKDNS
jgi:predicted DNA-binding protein (UPF0251 family)